jgi:hypothetical protein
MSLDSKYLAHAAADLKRDIVEEIAADKSAPAYTLEMARILLESPWVPDFLMPLVTPIRANMRGLLKMSVIRVDDRIWYFPGFNWWRTHARMCHGPAEGLGDGSCCNVANHLKYLTEESKYANFLQAHILKDGRLHVLGEEDFKLEEEFWKANRARFTLPV